MTSQVGIVTEVVCGTQTEFRLNVMTDHADKVVLPLRHENYSSTFSLLMASGASQRQIVVYREGNVISHVHLTF